MSGLIYNTANAQLRIHVGFNLTPRPVVYTTVPVVEQAPVYEQSAYDNNDDYYYLPDVNAYYNVNEQCYYYYDGDNWISAAYLPGEYRDYDWRNCRRFEVRASRPYLRNEFYRSRYNGHEIAWAHRDYDRNLGDYHANRDFRNDDRHFNHWDRDRSDRFDHSDRDHGNYGQRFQPNNDRGGYNQHYDNHREGGYAQPSNQNNGYGRDSRGNSEHFSQNNPRGGFGDHRMNKF